MRSVGRLAIFCLAISWCAGPANAQVRVWQGTIGLPTYPLGEEDRNPPFLFGAWPHIYPYTRLLDLTQHRELRSYRALFLENEYLKAIVLPDLGGRLYSLYDKVSQREVFYRNNVIKYAPLALRGAWISGGVEFSFPDGHSVTTVSPVFSSTRQNSDGSATTVVGDVDHVTEMYWQVELTLRPAQARLEQQVTLFNPTPTANLYWYWANAAVPASDDMQFIFPAREMHRHSRRHGYGYPVSEGIDYSWYRNVRQAISLFCRQVRRDFFGAYYHQSDLGVVHVADFRELPGKKYFSWGVADSGLVWTGLLTDEDGPYNEIQSGRFETQLNYDFMPPHRAESWTEYWYPVRGLGDGFVEATRQLALNVRFVPGSGAERPHAIVLISPTETIRDVRVSLALGPQAFREFGPVILEPLRPRQFAVPVEDLEAAKRSLSVRVEAENGKPLLRWSAADAVDGNPEFVATAGSPEPAPKASREMTIEELFLHGVELDKAHDEQAALKAYDQVLERDPQYIPALLKLAWRSYRAADYQTAQSLVSRALNRTDSDPAVHYSAGVIYRAANRPLLAEDSFWAAIRYGGSPAPALSQLGELALRRKEYEEAARLFERALSFNPPDALAATNLAVCHRLGAKRKRGLATIQSVLEKTPLLPFALAESWRVAMAGGDESSTAIAWDRWKKSVTRSVDTYLDVAAWYRSLGDLDAADALLRAASKELPASAASPLMYYYMASIARQRGEAQPARASAESASSASLERVFPHRLMDAEILLDATDSQPSDARAPYFLGNFLFARGRFDDAAALWRRALDNGLQYSVLHRNLGLHAWRVKNDLRSAASHYERALRLAPDDYRLYLDLDQIHFHSGNLQARARLFETAPAHVLTRDAMRVRRAVFLIQQRQFDAAIEALMNHRFVPGEHEIIVRQVFALANLEKGGEKMQVGDYGAAEAAFRRALEYPANFNIGRPDRHTDQEALYWLGEALQAAGNAEGARAAWEGAVGNGAPAPGVSRVFQALAMHRLGQTRQAEEAFDDILAGTSKEMAVASDFLTAGMADRFQGHADRACRSFRRALELDPFLWQARIEAERCGDRGSAVIGPAHQPGA
jgi:tetratricopeptide (TPR) repeat protein